MKKYGKAAFFYLCLYVYEIIVTYNYSPPAADIKVLYLMKIILALFGIYTIQLVLFEDKS